MQTEWWTKLSLYLVHTHPLPVFPNSFHIPGGTAHELISTLASCLLPSFKGRFQAISSHWGWSVTNWIQKGNRVWWNSRPTRYHGNESVSTVSIMPCIHEPVMLTPTLPNSRLEYTPLREGALWSSRLPEWHTSDTQHIHIEEMETESPGVMKVWLGKALIYSGVKRVSPSPGLPQTCLVTKAAVHSSSS